MRSFIHSMRDGNEYTEDQLNMEKSIDYNRIGGGVMSENLKNGFNDVVDIVLGKDQWS